MDPELIKEAFFTPMPNVHNGQIFRWEDGTHFDLIDDGDYVVGSVFIERVLPHSPWFIINARYLGHTRRDTVLIDAVGEQVVKLLHDVGCDVTLDGLIEPLTIPD